MANTKVILKKSGVSGNTPGNLQYGELALNYADGVLFYKNANNIISSITTGSSTNSFATINVNSTLLVANSNTDVLRIESGNGISLTTDSLNKTIIISGNSTSNPAIQHQSYTASGSSNTFSLGTQATSDSFVIASINGVIQDPSSYSVIGSNITFVTTPADGDNIDLRTFYSYSSFIKTNYAELPNTASDQVVDTYDKSEYRTAKYLIQGIYGSNVHCTEVVLTHNDTNVYKNEYGTMWTNNSLITVSATIDSTNINLVVTPSNSNTKIDVARISLAARTLT
jgi:hypothetical protein